ncbi:MAG: deoxynucleoside kinase [Chloroflexota bacterium]
MRFFITIAGNIGVGKSTLVALLADKLAWEPVYEAVDENPYLPDFYDSMTHWSFHSQVFFLSRRLQQHHDLMQSKRSIIQDRSVYEDAEIFARNLFEQGNMSQRDWHTYYTLYQTMSSLVTPPQLVVYLQASVDTLVRQIQHRGRDYEQNINRNYLERLNNLYEKWIADFSISPVLTINTDNLDYVQYGDHLDLIQEKIMERLRGKDFLELRNS